MWAVMPYLSIRALRADALFASGWASPGWRLAVPSGGVTAREAVK
jgi:hypothetical protein